jgi:hypothetical protein
VYDPSHGATGGTLGRARCATDLNHAERSTDEARQGETGHGVRYMLGIGTALAVIAKVVAFMIAM